MAKPTTKESTQAFDQALKSGGPANYVLKLYVAGMTPHSSCAIVNLNKICEDYLAGRYALEVIDLYQQPQLAVGEQIIAAPTLVKKLPLPLRHLVGDLSNTERTLIGLDLQRRT
jgi:circadian clock protein KaiB